MFSFGQWGLSPHLVPISVAEGPHLVPISLKMRSLFGPHFEKFRSSFHVGAVLLSPGNSADKLNAWHIAVEVSVDYPWVQAGRNKGLMKV